MPAALAACWNWITATFSGQPDQTFWCEISGRKFEEFNNSVGLFASHIPLQGSLEAGGILSGGGPEDAGPDPHRHRSAGVLLGRVFAGSDRGRGSRGSAFHFQSSLFWTILQSAFFSFDTVSACAIEPFKVLLSCIQSREGLKLEFAYDARRYREEDIARLAASYQTLLKSALENLDAPIGALDILPAHERERMLGEWNDTNVAFETTPAVHALFEACAQQTPDAVALVFEDQTLTYARLTTR